MTFIPFLPRLEAQEVLEDFYEGESIRGELEAELGSSLFHGGMSSWDASFQAKLSMDEAEAHRAATPEGRLYDAQLEAARFMRDATSGLHVVTHEEVADPYIFTPMNAPFVPEFWPDGPRKGLFNPAGPDRPFEDDLPPF